MGAAAFNSFWLISSSPVDLLVSKDNKNFKTRFRVMVLYLIVYRGQYSFVHTCSDNRT